MRSLYLYCILLVIISLFLGVFCYFSSNVFVKENIHLIYLIHFSLLLLAIPLLSDKITFILSPTFLTIGYTYITFIIGGWAFNHEMILWKNTLIAFKKWEYTNIMASFFICGSTLVHLAYLIAKKPNQTDFNKQKPSYSAHSLLLIIALFWFTFFSFFKFEISSIGGLGDYAIIPKTLAALTIISILAINRYKLRYLYYFIIIFTFAAFSFNDKREAVFLLLSIFLVESACNRVHQIRISTKLIFKLTISIVFTIYIILAMSILRGYGGFEAKSFPAALSKVPAYVKQSDFLPAFFQNIEVSITFYHSHQAIEFIEKDRSLMTMGETLIKFVFVPIPSSIIKKPESIIKSYTGYYNRADFEANISWPINFFAELFWNFGYWGVLLILPFIGFFNKIYFFLLTFLRQGQILRCVVLLFMYQNFIFFVRGSGLDLYFFYLLLSAIIFLICFYLPYLVIIMLSKSQRSNAE